jgi:assimilatory nitrate reductase catalytic subunit
MSKAAIRTACPYCGVGCGISAIKTGARSVEIKGDATHPANRGKLCSKGTHLGETVASKGGCCTRDRRPARELGRRLPSWRNASGHHRRHGPDSVAFYVSGQLLTEDYYVANKLMKGFIGSQHRHQLAPVHGERGRGAQPRVRRGCRSLLYERPG